MNWLTKHDTALVVLPEKKYEDKTSSVIDFLSKHNGIEICYVCFKRPASYIIKDMKEKGISSGNIFFLDTVGSYFSKEASSPNCRLLPGPPNFEALFNAIRETKKEKNSRYLVFDTVCALLNYKGVFEITKFFNDLCGQLSKESQRKILFIIKEPEFKELAKEKEALFGDMTMFANVIVDLSKKSK